MITAWREGNALWALRDVVMHGGRSTQVFACQTRTSIVSAALQEDVQVIGLSILSGAHNTIVPRVMELLKEKHMDDVLVLVGGIVPDEDAESLKRLGVAAVFQPGASLEGIIEFIRRSVPQTALTGHQAWQPGRALACKGEDPMEKDNDAREIEYRRIRRLRQH